MSQELVKLAVPTGLNWNEHVLGSALLRAGGFPAEKRRHSALTAKALATAARPGSLITPYLLDLFSRSSCFNLAAARGDLGYAPKLNTAEGMSRLFTALTRVRMQSRSP